MLCCFIIVTTLFLNVYTVKCDTNYYEKNINNYIQKYLKPMKKISDYFPNRAIELKLEMDENKARRISPLKRKPSSKHYFRVQNPSLMMTRSNDIPEIELPPSVINAPETTLSTTTATLSSATVPDPKEKYISLNDLKSILGDFESEIKTNSFENKPLKQRDFWIALGMKYGLKCNDNPKPLNAEIQPLVASESNLDKILQILKGGEVVNRNSINPGSKEDLHWFKIKIPKNS